MSKDSTENGVKWYDKVINTVLHLMCCGCCCERLESVNNVELETSTRTPADIEFGYTTRTVDVLPDAPKDEAVSVEQLDVDPDAPKDEAVSVESLDVDLGRTPRVVIHEPLVIRDSPKSDDK